MANQRTRNQVRREEQDQTFETGETRKAKVFAVCPTNEAHRGARVYKTGPVQRRKDEKTGESIEVSRRYCICDDCGKTWFQDGPPAE